MKYLTLIMAMSFYAQAKLDRTNGEWAGGGGNAIVCFEPQVIIAQGEVRTTTKDIINNIKKNKNIIPDDYIQYIESVEMFDLYEAKKRRGIDSKKPEILDIKDDEKFYDYFDRLSKRYDGRVYTMAYIVEAGKELIPDSRLIFHNTAMLYQNDLGSVTLPSDNCIVSTMAAQVNRKDYFEVHIDERLFNHAKHLRQSKATLILHELIYGLLRKHFKHEDSGVTRKLVNFLIAYDESFTEGTLAKALYELGIVGPRYEEETEIVRKYRASSVMTNIEFGLEYVHDEVLRNLDYEFYLFQESVLYKNILKKENEYGEIKVAKNFLDQINIIQNYLDNSQDEMFWRDILDKMNKYYSALLQTIRPEIEEAKLELLDILSKENFLSESDQIILNGRLNVYLNDYTEDHMDFKWFLEEIIKESEGERVLRGSIYQAFLSGTVCRSEVSTTSFPSPKAADSTCYEPLKLDVIIPKK